MKSTVRHERVVAMSFRWAKEAAAEQEFAEALSWLGVVEATEGKLPSEWTRMKASWVQCRNSERSPEHFLRRAS